MPEEVDSGILERIGHLRLSPATLRPRFILQGYKWLFVSILHRLPDVDSLRSKPTLQP